MEVINNNSEKRIPPSNHLVEAILVTIFCCLPFGIVSIIYAAKVEPTFYAGDEDAALQYSRNARKWAIIGLCCGLAVILLYFLFFFILGMGAYWMDNIY